MRRRSPLFENGKIINKITNQSITFKELAYAVYVNPGAEIILDQADEPSLEAMGTQTSSGKLESR